MKMSLQILFLGQHDGTSRHRAEAMQRLGHTVRVINPWEFFPDNMWVRKVLSKLSYEVGSAWLESYVYSQLKQRLMDNRFDMLWNDQCELIGPAIAKNLNEIADILVTYSVDDPFGLRDKKRFSLYREALRYYDITAVVRQPNIEEAYAWGAPQVIRVFRSADEIAHRQLIFTTEEKEKWASDVAFVGTWMPERGPFIVHLLNLGVPLTLYGNRWQKAQEWSVLRKVWRGPGLDGKDYVKAIQASKICLGLLSKGNRDLHTQRSAEIPYIGSVLCAERTEEHMHMYLEDKEAIFWSTPEECAEKCFALLNDDSRRHAIAHAGRERCIRSGYLNEPVIQRILDTLLASPPSKLGEKLPKL